MILCARGGFAFRGVKSDWKIPDIASYMEIELAGASKAAAGTLSGTICLEVLVASALPGGNQPHCSSHVFPC